MHTQPAGQKRREEGRVAGRGSQEGRTQTTRHVPEAHPHSVVRVGRVAGHRCVEVNQIGNPCVV